MANILYIPAHAILEYEEMKMLHRLGHNAFSLNGSYQNPEFSVESDKRPGISGWKPNHHLLDLAMQSSRANIHDGFYEWADYIIIMHKLDWIGDGREWLRTVVQKAKQHNVKVVWRTIGQSHSQWERLVKDFPEVQIIRYSPKERSIPDYAGEDTLIRFSVDKDEYCNWIGGDNRVHVFGQSLKERGDFVGYPILEGVTKGFERVMYGTKNAPGDAISPKHEVSWAAGALSYEDLKNQYRVANVAVYAGSIPASYTLTFLEMLMTGTPIVAIGKRLFNNERFFPNHDVYEVEDIIKNGENGFCSDNPEELRSYISKLLHDKDLRKKISHGARQTALELFNNEITINQWKEFLQ